MTTFHTRVFQNGGSQAVRIPADLRFEDGAEVSLWRDPKTNNIVISSGNGSNPLVELAQEILSLPKGSELISKVEAAQLISAIKHDALLKD